MCYSFGVHGLALCPSPPFMRTQDFSLFPVFIFLTLIWMASLQSSGGKMPFKSRTIDIVDKGREITTISSSMQTEKQDTCHYGTVSETQRRFLRFKMGIHILRFKHSILRFKWGILRLKHYF
jgi:hypothetical protein